MIHPREDIAEFMEHPESGSEGAPTLLRRSDGTGLLYEACINVFCGPPGCGKSWLALVAVCECIEAGLDVWFLDYESTGRAIGRRLSALGLAPDDVRRFFHYHRVDGQITSADRGVMHRAIESTAPVLIVFDSVLESLSGQGLDENSSGDVATWFAELVRPLARQGPAILLLDHVVKATEGRAGWMRGSGHKLAAVDGAAYGLNVDHAWHRGGNGHADFEILKDREGHVGPRGSVAASVDVGVLDGGARVIFTINPSSIDLSAPAARAADYLSPEQVAERLAHSGGTWSSLADAMAALNLTKSRARAALDGALIARAIVEVHEGSRMTYRLPESDQLDLDLQELLAERHGTGDGDGEPLDQ